MMALVEDGKMTQELVHIARLGLAGSERGLQVYLRKLARGYRDERPDFAEQLMGLVRSSSPAARPTRFATADTVPVDGDTRLPLMRVVESPVFDIEPIYTTATKFALEQIVREQQSRDKLSAVGATPTRTVLFTGPPGVGKTYAASWLARVLDRPLVTLDLASVMSSFLGRTGSNVRAAIDYAKNRDCVFLLDELDALAKRRDDATELGELKRLVTVLLQEIDDWPSSGLLLAATNHPSLLDPAVWRRFEGTIEFPVPTRDVLRDVCTQKLGEGHSRWADILATIYEGGSFSDLARKLNGTIRYAAVNDLDFEVALEATIRQEIAKCDRDRRIEVARQLIVHHAVSQRQASDWTGLSRDTIRKHSRS